LPSIQGESEQIEGIILNAFDLLPSAKHTYRYNGSLTIPPCSEDVKWFVLTTPIKMAHSQIAAFKAIMSGNNRPVQPLNGRELLVDAIQDG
jgi:carbonic anhydrase